MLLCGIVTIHFCRYAYVFKIPGKYHGEADEHSLSTESDSGKLESTVMRLVADREKLVVKLVGQYKRVDLSAERRACCGTKMKAVGGFNRSLKPTSSSEGDKKKEPGSFTVHSTENYSVFDTLIRFDFTFKLYKAFFGTVAKKIGRHSETSFCLFSHITKPNYLQRYCKPKC